MRFGYLWKKYNTLIDNNKVDEYIYVEREDDDTFFAVINYLKENDIPLAGAVHDFTDSKTGKNYMFFPIRKL